jgi:hypothetical protein
MSDIPSSVDLNGSLGAIEIGAVLGAFLFGLETLQTFNYYRDFPKDSKFLKATVRSPGSVLWVGSSDMRICRLHSSGEVHGPYSQTTSQVFSRVLELGHTVSAWHAVGGNCYTVELFGSDMLLALFTDCHVLRPARLHSQSSAFRRNHNPFCCTYLYCCPGQ